MIDYIVTQQYIDDKMIDYIVTQTNLYVAQYLEKEQGNLRPHSLVHEWKLTDRAEMLDCTDTYGHHSLT